eukprot:4575205-Amphidinium_carterae.1
MQNQCPKGKGKGGKAKGKEKGGKGKVQCHKRWGYGHYAANCPTRLSFEADGTPAQGSAEDWWWWWWWWWSQQE